MASYSSDDGVLAIPQFLIGVTASNFSALNPFLGDTAPFDQNTFSFQDAFRPIARPWGQETELGNFANPVYLITDGCNAQNCTMACMSKSMMFSNINTFHNCMAYPMIAQLYADGNISASANQSAMVDNLNIQKSRQGSDLLNNITSTIQSCLNSYCRESPECLENLESNGEVTIFNSTSASIFMTAYENQNATYSNGYQGDSSIPNEQFAFVDQLCSFQTAGLNADIGGIGVYVSYWAQSGLAILGALSVLWWGWGVYYCCFFTHSLRHGHRAAKEYAERTGAKFGNKRLPSVISALTDFQKAQCFFMLAINIAAQVNRGRGGFQPTSLQQLYNNYIVIKTISISGYLPITFTLFTLHCVGMVSWYLIVLSVLTVAISIATLVDIGNFAPSQADLQYLLKQSITGGPAECGDMNLLVYCLETLTNGYGTNNDPSTAYYPSDGASNPSDGAYSILAFCLVVLFFLVLDQVDLFKKLPVLETRPWLSKTQNFLIANFFGVRGAQLALAVLAWEPLGWVCFMPLFPCTFSLCLLYILITSDLRYRPRENVAGRFFNKWIVFAADVLSWSLALAYLVICSLYFDTTSSASGTSIILGVFLLLTFTLTLILTSAHIHGSRNKTPRKQKSPRQYPLFIRRLLGMLSSGWRAFQTAFFNTKSQSFVSHTSRFRRNIKSAADADDWAENNLAIVIFLLYVMFFVFYLYWFAIFFLDLFWFVDKVDFNTWSFGQVVAITVWAQPLCEYFHLELRGMSRGFQHRLMWPYKVIIHEEDIEKGQDKGGTSVLSKPKNDTTTERGSYEMLSRERADSDTASASLTKEASQDGFDENSRPTSRLDDTDPALYQEKQDWDEPRLSTSGFEEQDISHERWQIPESVLMTSDELKF